MHSCELHRVSDNHEELANHAKFNKNYDKPCQRHAEMLKHWSTDVPYTGNGTLRSEPPVRSSQSNNVKRPLNRDESSTSAQSSNTYASSCKGTRGIIRWARLEEPPSGDDLEDDAKGPGGPGLDERELWSLHRALPGLRKHDPKTSTIRQHYYPEGGWGWIVCGGSFLVQLFTTGLQFASGAFANQIVRKFGHDKKMDAAWICVICLSTSYLLSPLVVALCRRKSTRLMAIIGGLVMALSCLFSSFATELHQVFLSYGIILGIGICMVRESACLMTGQYFKRKRNFVEIVLQVGTGIGIVLFSIFFRQGLSQMGWRYGLQTATGLTCIATVVGFFYRSASLYHPQRRAILHLKTQRKKVKSKGKPRNDKPPYFDFSVLRYRSLQVILLASGVSSFGVYTPLFYLGLQGEEEGLEEGNLLLVQTFFGLAVSVGVVTVGLIVVKPSSQCTVSLQYLCQVTLMGIAMSELAMTAMQGYHGYVLFSWMYGFCLGGYQYALPMFVLERLRAKNFARSWSFVEAIRFLPILLGVPITGYINQSSSRSGYYFSCIFTAIGSLLFFFIGVGKKNTDDLPDNYPYNKHRTSLPVSSSGTFRYDSPQPECTCKNDIIYIDGDDGDENRLRSIKEEKAETRNFEIYEEESYNDLDEYYWNQEIPLERIMSLPKIVEVPPPPSPPKLRTKKRALTKSDPDLFTTLSRAKRQLISSVSSIEKIVKKDRVIKPVLKRQNTWHDGLYHPEQYCRKPSVQLIEQITTSV